MQPNTSYDESLVLYHLSSESTYYTIFHVTAWLLCCLGIRWGEVLLLAEVGEEVHLEGIGQFRSGAEGEVDVAGEDLGDVRARDVHAAGELGLADAELLHAAEDTAEKGGADMVDCGQGIFI